MSHPLSPHAQKVQVALRTLGFPHEVIELSQTTRSAAEAAQAIGCKVEEIAKSESAQTKPSWLSLVVQIA
jgi:prolyl-tRNA editing enzyme YbaK/EbsC (Cys-tRNA(Pro) deacylase)